MSSPTPLPVRRDARFWAVLAAAFAFHLYVILHWQNLAWPDEIFQTLEQGHRLAFGFGIVPWEFRTGVRSWFLPALLGGVMRLTAGLGPGSQGYLQGVAGFLSLASLAPVAVAMIWAQRAGLRHGWIAGVACACWYELVFFSGKALTEVFAGYALAAALLVTVEARRKGLGRDFVIAGCLWGLTVGLRLQLAPAALVGIAWAGRKDLRRWGALLAGAAGVFTAFGMLDWITWSYPFQSYFLNFWINVVKGKAASFGTSPWNEYLISLFQTWDWSAIPLLGLALLAFRRWSLLWMVALVILGSHSAIGHKEYRFLAPFLDVLVIAAGVGLAAVVELSPKVGIAIAAVFLAASASGAGRYDWRTLAPRPTGFPPSPMWTFREGALRGYEALSTDPTVCGVGSAGIGWAWTGGYTYLHRDLNVFQLGNGGDLLQRERWFNALVAPNMGKRFGPFTQEQCWDWLCLYRRPGGCAPPPGYDFNAAIAAAGE